MNKLMRKAAIFHKDSEKKYESIKKRWVVNSLSIAFGVIAFAVLAVCVSAKQFFCLSVEENLTSRAESTAQFIELFLNDGYDDFYYASEEFISRYAQTDKYEYQILDSAGRIVFSSSGITAGYAVTTDDVYNCLKSKQTEVWNGENESTGEHIMSSVSPVRYSNGQIIGMVRLSTSVEAVDRTIIMVYIEAICGGILIFLFVFMSNYHFIRSIVNPIVKLNDIAKQISAGSYGVQIENSLSDEVGELCNSINNMSTAICKAEKTKNDIISSVSHELRTPLTAIGGWSETLLASSGDMNQICKNGLEIIHKEAKRLSQMVEQLLDFSKLESGRFTLQTESFDLRGEFSDAAFIYKDILKRD